MPLALRVPLVALSSVLIIAAGPLRATMRAQTPDTARRAEPRADSLSADSLRARLARAEAAIALLREQIAGESESAVHMRSRLHAELSATILTNAFATLGRVNNVDVPQTALAPLPGAPATTDDALGLTVRQTRFGGAVSVSDVAGATFSGDVDLDLFGGVQNGPGDRRLFPEPRLRTARARLSWARTEVMVGSETPLISDLNPLSLASVGIPDFSGAGNLWNWLGQVRVRRDLFSLGGGVRTTTFAIQGALLSPNASQTAPAEPDLVDAGERSRRPAVEARASARWGEAGDPGGSSALLPNDGGEVGVGVHRGWVSLGADSLLASYATAMDARIILVHGVELRGEAYTGRLLRGLGGGGIAQNFGAPAIGAPAGTLGAPLRDVAGWAQLNTQLHPLVIAGAGCGIDATRASDAAVRRQNTVCAAHAEWRPAQPIVIGAEYREIGTRFTTGLVRARHVNLVFGVEL